MAVNNYMCLSCEKMAVCKVYDKLCAFDEDAKKQLGVDLTMDSCTHCVPDKETPEEAVDV